MVGPKRRSCISQASGKFRFGDPSELWCVQSARCRFVAEPSRGAFAATLCLRPKRRIRPINNAFSRPVSGREITSGQLPSEQSICRARKLSNIGSIARMPARLGRKNRPHRNNGFNQISRRLTVQPASARQIVRRVAIPVRQVITAQRTLPMTRRDQSVTLYLAAYTGTASQSAPVPFCRLPARHPHRGWPRMRVMIGSPRPSIGKSAV